MTFVPILYNTEIPIFPNNINGIAYESNATPRIIAHSITAIITYIITSELHISFISKFVADIPLILQFSSVISLSF